MANEDKKDFNAMLHDSKDMPKLQIITDQKSIEKYGGNKMYFAPPIDYDKVMKSIPKGKVITVGAIRDYEAALFELKRVVFSDIDGTLLNSEHKITPLTEQAIKKLKSRKIPFVIISARSPSGIYPILDEYGFSCPIISYSGALILDENRNVLFHKGIKKSNVKKLIEFIESSQFDMSWCIYSLDEWIVKDKSDPRIIREENIVKAEAVQGDVNSITDDEINKILCICNPEKILEIEEKLKEAFPDYSIVKSSDILLEIMESGITKATAVQALCSIWDIPLSEAVAFGDNYNDIEMLEAVGGGILMGNAPAQLKERIKIQTNDNDHDGIYYGLLKMNLI